MVTKVRAAWVDDAQLCWLAKTYPCPTLEVLPEVIDTDPPRRRKRRPSGSGQEAS